MDNYRAVALAEGFEEGSEGEVLEAWQHLVYTGLAWSLQGWCCRMAVDLLKAGKIKARTLRAVRIVGGEGEQ